ncbi:MAG: PD40 domain-containing protein [Flavobacteriales bacterium]|nr:PD40 domain-containing protein [Flavobacteriales bacterium]
MKTTIAFIALVCMTLWACNDPAPVKDKEYLIAYNIHIPDTSRDDWEIMVMNFDGSDKKNILQNDDVAWTYYAYEDQLYFISDRDTAYRNFYLYRCDPNGNNIKKVSDLRLEDSWMSSRNNGKELAVAGRMGTEVRYQLFIINTENGEYRQLTNDTAALFRDPCFSPDGKQLVASYQANKRDRTAHEELFLINDDGTVGKQITRYPEDNPSAQEYGYRAGSARWHPTENFISYVSKQDGRHSIFATTPDGNKNWKLIENPASEGWHDWSSDGKWLVYNNSDAEEMQFHISLMNWKTKEVKQLTDTTYRSQLSPVFVVKQR